jgi:hypothetical protein
MWVYHHVVGQVHDTVLRNIPRPSLWYSAQEMGVQINVLDIRKCVAIKSVETTRRHEPECRTLHIQYRENLKTHTVRIWMFSCLHPHRLLICVGTSYLNILCFGPEECMKVEWITQSLKINFCECRSIVCLGNKRKCKRFETLRPSVPETPLLFYYSALYPAPYYPLLEFFAVHVGQH